MFYRYTKFYRFNKFDTLVVGPLNIMFYKLYSFLVTLCLRRYCQVVNIMCHLDLIWLFIIVKVCVMNVSKPVPFIGEKVIQ